MEQSLTSDDFFTGLFSALALKGHSTISLRLERFDSAVAKVFEALRGAAAERKIALRFRVRLHPVHGDSPTIRDSITNAAQRDLISLDNPEYQDIRLKIADEDARVYLKGLPGGQDLFDKLADEFLQQYV